MGIKDEEGVRVAYEEIMRNVKNRVTDARINGILVEEMAVPSTEVIVGGLRDPHWSGCNVWARRDFCRNL